MPKKVLAITNDGRLTYCSAPEEERGKGRCNHIAHQNEGQTERAFLDSIDFSKELVHERVTEDNIEEAEKEFKENSITQTEIDDMAKAIDEIAGERVTPENFEEVMSKLSPEKIHQITQIGFDAAPQFSLPITDEDYADANLENKLYFSTLPSFGISGKNAALEQMFDKVGEVPGFSGPINIEHSYKEGLTESEYFAKSFSARAAAISKSISVSKPGYLARLLYFSSSDMSVIDDCNGDHSKGIIGCSHKNGVCKKCAKNDGLDLKSGSFIGGRISTNLSENLTQSEMKKFHSGGKIVQEEQRDDIYSTFMGWKTSPVIQNVLTGKTTLERREKLYEGIKEEYKKNNIKIDDYNLKLIAKQLTSFKRDSNGKLQYVKDNEVCDIVSLGSVGNFGNPFKAAELSTPYKNLTKPAAFNIFENALGKLIFGD